MQNSNLFIKQPLRYFANRLQAGLIVWLVVLPVIGWSQSTGLGLWSGVNVEKKFTKKFALQVSTQLRFSENVSVTRAFLGEAGLSYKLNKSWEISGFYRYTGRRKWNKETDAYYYRPYHRYYGQITYDHKIWGNLKLDYRLRYQNQFKDDVEGLVAAGSYLRNKVELSYKNPSRLTPFISADLFYLVGVEFDQIRYKAGVSADLTKTQSLDVTVFKDAALSGSEESSGAVIGVTYKVKLGYKKKKVAKESNS
ncbi:DUF2490 domain-containing protein [Larkinella sp. C7]|jgi:hypothetical protein|uniref:DUF2490 domain-containing protein n=1 Tax=Larkinella sp. C7 TaxID=2576607 RepID=UPI001E335120|nr:DUF2490 domain-containing protein [Larkinella sp. C7]